jgi:hypothetical protein
MGNITVNSTIQNEFSHCNIWIKLFEQLIFDNFTSAIRWLSSLIAHLIPLKAPVSLFV